MNESIKKAVAALKKGKGIIIVDDAHRENEADLVYAASTMKAKDMALMIRHCSGIVCLCLTKEKARKLKLKPMVRKNTSRYGTGFTVSIEATHGVTTGVSAADRITTIKAAIASNAKPKDLARPGHIFPLIAHPKGVLKRRGHTEASIDIMKIAGLEPTAVLCELMNDDGTMAQLKDYTKFAKKYKMPIITIQDVSDHSNSKPATHRAHRHQPK